MKIGIIGAGTWGMALAKLLYDNGNEVTVFSAVASEIEEILSTRKVKNLPDMEVPEEMKFTTELSEVLQDKDVLVMAVASPYVRRTAKLIAPHLAKGQIIVSVAKGVEEGTLFTMTQIIEDECREAKVAVLSGPSHAEEVSRGMVTTVVIGCREKETARFLQHLFINDNFRVYTSPDVKGIEIGGSIKNVVALAAGIADGLGCGDNCKAALITRGIVEISRLGAAMGCDPSTFYGLSGIGDLIVTCASMHSRNRRAGILIGQGKTCKEACDEVAMVVEGVHCAKAAKELAEKYQVDMPIINEVYEILFDDRPASEALKNLMLRDPKTEQKDALWDV